MPNQIVTIHANSTSADLMKGTTAATRHISLPGHDDVPLQGEYSLPVLTQHVIDTVGTEPTIFIGNSVGGIIAHQIADKVNTRAIISIGSPPLNYEVLDGCLLNNDYAVLSAQPELTKAEARKLAEGCTSVTEKSIEIEKAILNSNPEVRTGLMKSIGEGHLRDEYAILSQLNIPILFIVCTQDQFINNKKFENIGFGEVIEVDAGHLLPFENPQLFNQIVDDFLAKHQLV